VLVVVHPDIQSSPLADITHLSEAKLVGDMAENVSVFLQDEQFCTATKNITC
jgi:hypothetical protein